MADLDAKQVATFVAVLGIIVVVLAVFFSVAVNLSGDQTEQVDFPTEDQAEPLVQNFRVDDRTTASLTLGNGIELDNDDDLDLVTGDANVTDGPWAVAVSPRVNNETNQTDVPRTLVSVDNGSLLVWYNDSEYHAYYSNGSHSATVTKSPSSAGTYSPLVVQYNGSALELEEDSTVNSSALDTSNETVPIQFDWVGSIDELRLFNESLTSSQRDQYQSEPVEPINADTTVRYLFDEQDGSEVFAYYANETVSLNGAEETDGVAGPGLNRGTDFDAADDPPRVEILSGGTADGAPVVYVSSPAGPFGGLLVTIGNLGSAAISLVALTAIIMAAGRVIGVMDEF